MHLDKIHCVLMKFWLEEGNVGRRVMRDIALLAHRMVGVVKTGHTSLHELGDLGAKGRKGNTRMVVVVPMARLVSSRLSRKDIRNVHR